MAQRSSKHRDNWGTGVREGYEDRGAFRPPRAPRKEPGSPLLRTIGGLSIVGGICWGVYLETSKKRPPVSLAIRSKIFFPSGRDSWGNLPRPPPRRPIPPPKPP